MNKEKADEVRDRQRAWAAACDRDKLGLLRLGYTLAQIRAIVRQRQVGARWQTRHGGTACIEPDE